jgi:hypothetical protein
VIAPSGFRVVITKDVEDLVSLKDLLVEAFVIQNLCGLFEVLKR